MQTPLDERADLRVVEENVRIDGDPNVERFSIEWFLVAPAAASSPSVFMRAKLTKLLVPVLRKMS